MSLVAVLSLQFDFKVIVLSLGGSTLGLTSLFELTRFYSQCWHLPWSAANLRSLNSARVQLALKVVQCLRS